jgi:multidrug transporter EmrE-like cation transporter
MGARSTWVDLQRPLLESAPPLAPSERAAGYALLAAAILAEVAGTTCMRISTATPAYAWWRVGAYACYAASFAAFPSILTRIPLAVAYATWSGAGSALVAVVSAVVFGEALRARQLVALVGIACGVALLQA